jgi:hypothetical protein
MIRFAWLILIAFCCFGCVRTTVKKGSDDREHDATLALVQTEDMVTLSWESKPGYVYRLYKKNDRNLWDRVEAAPDYRGTGDTMYISLNVRKGRELPLYAVRGIKVN